MGCPLFGSNSGLFTVPGFIVSLVGIKKKKDRRKKRYKGRERRSRTRKKEREEGVKRKEKIIIKNHLKKKKFPAGFKLAKPVLLVYLAAADSAGLV